MPRRVRPSRFPRLRVLPAGPPGRRTARRVAPRIAAPLLAALLSALLPRAVPGAAPPAPAPAVPPPGAPPAVLAFSPEGTVKKVRQVAVRFSEPMVPFGDPRLADPFDVDCPAPGKGRWADNRNWAYDFDEDIPAGIVCTFSLKPSLTALSGTPLGGRRSFTFSTGGPAVVASVPGEGTHGIAEDQAFVLLLDGAAEEASILDNAAFAVPGIGEAVGVEIVRGEDRKAILLSGPARFIVSILDRKRARVVESLEFRRKEEILDDPRIVVLRARRSFPNGREVRLSWGPGIRAATGVATEAAQVLPFVVREPFEARFSCDRENPRAACIPILPMEVRFTAPVAAGAARRVVLEGPGGRIVEPTLPETPGGDADTVMSVVFRGPFPEKTPYKVRIPADMTDDAGRTLANAGRFPLDVATDAFPPLAKFAAPFGIVERSAEPLLPVTLRNLEAEVPARRLDITGDGTAPAEGAAGTTYEGVTGRLLPISPDREDEIVRWIRAVRAADSGWDWTRGGDRRGEPLLAGGAGAREFRVPKPHGARAFEVVGIPLGKPGFYVVEVESRILGSSLLGADRPMYAAAAALVTDLAVHFKWGREASVAWVTSLSTGRPVPGARVAVRLPGSAPMWEGTTDDSGIARIAAGLPDPVGYGDSRHHPHTGLFVTARAGDDMAFLFTDWDQGIEPYRFGLGYGSDDPSIAHTVFDRTLLRAGETVSMKHFFRRHAMDGIRLPAAASLPKAAAVVHEGSGQRYEFPLSWTGAGAAETRWTIPKDAALGTYRVLLLESGTGAPAQRREVGRYREGDETYWRMKRWESGSFRVEEYRVPLMRGSVTPVGAPLVGAREATLDLQLSYLAGGGAGGSPVTLRTALRPRHVSFPDFEEFAFANGGVREGLVRAETRRYLYDGDFEEAWEGEEAPPGAEEGRAPPARTKDLVLDGAGALRTAVPGLPAADRPFDLVAEMEYRDPNGETQTVSSRVPLWPSGLVVGIRPDSWAASKDGVKFHVRALTLTGAPAAGVAVEAELFRRTFYSHRRRLVGGFYAYEHVTETKRIGPACAGTTDASGLLACEATSPVSGNVIVLARAHDAAGRTALAHRDVWVAGKDDWWFDAADGDRMDLLPERKAYEPGETARFQVRMPFREAHALVTVEREGVVDAFVTPLSGKAPVVDVPVPPSFAPNVYVSVLAVRGRSAEPAPTATVDLGRPAFRLGVAAIRVGWKAHALEVSVAPGRQVYKVREKATARIRVRRAAEGPLPAGSEVAVAAVDEGLLELSPNRSVDLLAAMMGRRPYEVRTATAAMQVVGKRHFGLKALPAGGGGGRQPTRELFDTLLYWNARVPLDGNGEAEVTIPLNDSLTSFRIVAAASGGADLFGSGEASIRTTQDVMLLPGFPPLVREGDRFRGVVTVRNGTEKPFNATVTASVSPGKDAKGEASGKRAAARRIAPQTVTLAPGEAKEVGWDHEVPAGAPQLAWEVAARAEGVGEDRVRSVQKVVPAVPVRTYQATIARVDRPLATPVSVPAGALPGRGGVDIGFRARLAEGTGAIRHFMSLYPYTCLEQRVSQAVALRDPARWKAVMASLPAHLDGDGLARYFPSPWSQGSDVLTAYLLAVAHEAGYGIPEDARRRMAEGLAGFVEGRVIRGSALRTADLSIRKVAAVEALSRYGLAKAGHLDTVTVEPNLWPTSAVVDWLNVLLRVTGIPRREERRREAEQVLRARLNFQGTTMGFSTERTDALWWLMVSGDVNAVRGLLLFLELPGWEADIPRIVNGAVARQRRGAWNTTVANAWGVLALEKFSAKYESAPVTGRTKAALAGADRSVDWRAAPKGGAVSFPWPRGPQTLSVDHAGTGAPWAEIRSLAAIPLKEPLSTGYRIRKTVAAVTQKEKGRWSRGDVARVTLDLEAQADMTWVVVSDPVPAGATILGSGLGRDAGLLAEGERREGLSWPAYTERSFEAYRTYYAFVPKGKWTVAYTVRVNNGGTFLLPPTRVEALYAPEMFGELPNGAFVVRP